ncbi:MAG: hypothetical protein KJZ86_08260 [Caldilineaceae bacterium]|nr:hypothetical protein [Caldilineaceae bacterium]HRJ44678.1 hypothetical protein [Caldilineaceae bacterium]
MIEQTKQLAVEDVELALDQLNPVEQWRILERLLFLLKQNNSQQRQPQDLFGIWKDVFPEDFDIDKELYEIRHAWEEEWSDLDA